MSRIVPLRPWHLRLVEPQAEQVTICAGQLNERFGTAVVEAGPAWACVDAHSVYGCAGFILEDSRALAWAVLGRNAGRRLLAIHRAVKAQFESMRGCRIDALVRDGHAEGERWAQMLGMEVQGNRAQTHGGNTYRLWSLS